ncbi:hypothetical protein [Legionella anisa]|uniref:hypothetical protein n=1 Tax=Legionella anisa TaxID=28082 RepID=UPI000D708105|nr:hypothetical protein [Legionella anisa]AWN75222.1 hypothetical protein DLD14_16065 [Legionella anisa]HAT9164395.1 hypothetical protein [Legionella pneumophila subsp. pneumophila]
MLSSFPNKSVLTVLKPYKSNSNSEATTQYFFCPSATPFIEAIGKFIKSRLIVITLCKCLGKRSYNAYASFQNKNPEDSYDDGVGHTYSMLLLQYLLMRENLMPVLLTDSNMIPGLSVQQLVDEYLKAEKEM